MLTPFWRLFAGPTGRLGGHPNATLIVPKLLLGEYPTPDDAAWLRRVHGVTSVVNLQDHGDLASKGLNLIELEQAYRQHGIRLHHIPVPDGDTESLEARLEDAVALLERLLADGCVYLHCNAGLNRAPTVAIAYLHARGGYSLRAARDLVKQRRPCVPYMTLLESYYASPRRSPS
jgi:protein-tyrosine phosphatase